MHKLIAVEEAKKLFTVAQEWSIWRWLFEKRRVRTIADAATTALYDEEKKVKGAWAPELARAFRDPAKCADGALAEAVRRVKEADQISEEARLDAEAAFDEAEKRLSGELARQGALKALKAYDLHEKAIRRAEWAGRLKSAPGIKTAGS